MRYLLLRLDQNISLTTFCPWSFIWHMFQLHVAALVSHRTGLCHTDQCQGVLDSGSCSCLMSSESNVGQTQGYLDNWRVKSSNFSAVSLSVWRAFNFVQTWHLSKYQIWLGYKLIIFPIVNRLTETFATYYVQSLNFRKHLFQLTFIIDIPIKV